MKREAVCFVSGITSLSSTGIPFLNPVEVPKALRGCPTRSDTDTPARIPVPPAPPEYTPISTNLLIPKSNSVVKDWTGPFIPVIVIPIIWEASFLMDLLRSVDVPVGRIILVQNSLSIPKSFQHEHEVMAAVDAACRNAVQSFVNGEEFIQVHRPGRNLGFGGSMNHGILSTLGWADWWLLLNAGHAICPSLML